MPLADSGIYDHLASPYHELTRTLEPHASLYSHFVGLAFLASNRLDCAPPSPILVTTRVE